MNNNVTVVFDGKVLHPDTPLGLTPNRRYSITIQEINESDAVGDAWDVLEKLAGTVEAPPDWSSEHDHYLYGTPKTGTNGTP